MTALAQTPGTWLKAGGFSRSDDECRKALAACGLDPDKFRNYKAVAKSQTTARRELREAAKKKAGTSKKSKSLHVAPCTLDPDSKNLQNCRCQESPEAWQVAETEKEWLHANGQSGHISQDAFYRAEKGRDDPCMNHPPDKRRPPSHAGTYGYDTGRARCMEHYGRSSLKGSPHEQVCRAEGQFAATLKPGEPVSQAQLREGAGRSAVVAVTAGRLRVDETGKKLVPANLSGDDKSTQKDFQSVQKGVAKEMKDTSGDVKNKFTGDDLSETEKIAVECIVQDWEASLAALQAEAISEYGPGSKKGQQNAADAYNRENKTNATWGDLTPKQRQAAVAARQKELEAKNANKNPLASSDGGPTKADCREYQANWLYQQQEAGGIPPMQAKAPGTPSSGGSDGNEEGGKSSDLE